MPGINPDAQDRTLDFHEPAQGCAASAGGGGNDAGNEARDVPEDRLGVQARARSGTGAGRGRVAGTALSGTRKVLAPPALDRRTVTAEQMAQAVAQALQPERVRAAAELGEKIRAENGGAAAVRALTEWGLLPPPRLARDAAAPALERVA